MAKRTIDFSDYNDPTWEEYVGEDPIPGKWYNARTTEIEYDEKEDQLLARMEITDGDFKGWGRRWYAPFDGSTKWKSQELVKAMMGGKKPVTIDWDNKKAVAAWVAKGKPFKIKIQLFNERISIQKLMPLLQTVGEAKASTPSVAPEPEPTEDPALEDYTEEELGELEASALEEILTDEFEAALPAKPARDRSGEKYKDALIDAILEVQEGADDDAEEELADEGDADPDAEEFDDGFEDGEADEPEPEPEPAPRARRASRTAPTKAAPAKAAAPAATTRRTRRG